MAHRLTVVVTTPGGRAVCRACRQTVPPPRRRRTAETLQEARYRPSPDSRQRQSVRRPGRSASSALTITSAPMSAASGSSITGQAMTLLRADLMAKPRPSTRELSGHTRARRPPPGLRSQGDGDRSEHEREALRETCRRSSLEYKQATRCEAGIRAPAGTGRQRAASKAVVQEGVVAVEVLQSRRRSAARVASPLVPASLQGSTAPKTRPAPQDPAPAHDPAELPSGRERSPAPAPATKIKREKKIISARPE